MAAGAAMTIRSIRRRRRKLARDEARLDRLTEADVVGDEEVHPRNAEGLAER